MIAVNNISVRFTGTTLFENVTFNINDRDRIGLVGKNGAGKSTLLKILCGKVEPESGNLVVTHGQSVGYLPQEMIPSSEGNVLEETMKAFYHINALEAERQEIEQSIAERTDYQSTEYNRLLQRLEEVNNMLQMQESNNRQEQAERVLLGLGFNRSDFDRPVSQFSGGWQMRVELAKLLLQRPEFLLLDEPTNHLDIVSIQWLENYLANYRGAVVTVSHDRTFLDNITNRTIEITARHIYDYKVSYSEYVVQMQERRASQMASLTTQQRQIAQIEAFIERFRYKPTKSRQVQSRVKMLERMDRIVVDEVTTDSIHFAFQPAPHSGRVVVEAINVGKAFGEKRVFANVNLTIERGAKAAFVGRNGEGKTTLARMIVGALKDYEGTLRIGHQVQIGYYAQNQAAMLDGSKTVFQTIDDIAVGDIRPRIRSILGSFLFDNDDIDKRVSVLSGGEKARLALAKLLLAPSNLLVLDEPTNHLDMDSKDVLKNALLQYDGTLIIVSHDRDFLQGLTTSLYEFRDGNVHLFNGEIFDYLESRKLNNLTELESTTQPTQEKHANTPSQGKQQYEQNKERERELRKLKSTVNNLEQAIEDLELKIDSCEKLFASSPESASTEKLLEYQQMKEQLDTKLSQWEEASIELDNFINK